MEKRFNLKVSGRINEKCRQVIDQVSFNHLILCDKEHGDHKKFQLDKIYSPNDKNEKLFEQILRVPSNLMLEGFSSMVFCLGSPNSGKTYSLVGKTTVGGNQEETETGIVIYMMRRLYSKFKHQVSLNSTYSFWCKFLFVQRDKVHNQNSQLNQQDSQNNFNTKIQLTSYSHFITQIGAACSRNNNKSHTIIELILQKQTPNQQPTTSSITFVEFGSFFYNCPYRQAQQLSMENDIQSTLMVIKNLQKAKQNSSNANIFDSSLLTKVLKKNFLKSISFQFLGILDDSYPNNLKTLNFLDIIMHKKQNYASTRNVKQQIKRQEALLKNLYEKHRKVLNLLSRCIGMELGYLDKQKKKRNFDGPILNTFYKTCQKIKFANQKKLQNEKALQEIRKNTQKQKQEMNQIQLQYQQKFKKLQQEKQQLLNRKNELNLLYQTIINPNIKFSTVDNSLFFKLDENDQKSHKKFTPQQQQQAHGGSLIDSQRESKNDGKSLKMFPSTPQITTRKNIITRFQQNAGKDKQNQKYERSTDQQIHVLATRRVNQIKAEIGKLFSMIVNQQSQIQNQKVKLPLHCNLLLNKIKNHQQNINFNLLQAKECLMSTGQNSSSPYHYSAMLQNLKIQDKIDKDLISNYNVNSLGVISMRSLRSQKQFKNL